MTAHRAGDMNERPKVQLLPKNPNAAYLKGQGWLLPCGTFKPHHVEKPAAVPVKPRSLWQRIFGK